MLCLLMPPRFEIEDFSGAALAEAEEERDKHPTFVAPFALNSRGEWVQTFKGVSEVTINKLIFLRLSLREQ